MKIPTDVVQKRMARFKDVCRKEGTKLTHQRMEVFRKGAQTERPRFDANLDRHHHFVCTRCGLTRDFSSDAFDRLALPDAVRAIGHVEKTQVEVKGLCLECAADAKRAEKKHEKEVTP